MESGYIKADSTNLPKLDSFIVPIFFYAILTFALPSFGMQKLPCMHRLLRVCIEIKKVIVYNLLVKGDSYI